MKDFITLCVQRPIMIIMLVAAIFLGGIFSAVKLPIDRLPEIYFPRITVETNYSGMGAEEIRGSVTIPIEDALSPLKGLEKIRSVSRDGTSIVILDFRWGTNPSSCAVLVREAIDAVYGSLPQGVSKPIVVSGGSTDETHAIIGVSSRSGDSFFERNFCEYELRTRLRRIENAGNIILTGGDKKEIHIILDIPKAASRGISPSDLANIIAYETNEVPAGNAREGNMELVVLSSGKPQSVKELSELVVASAAGPLRLKEIAKIEEAAAKKKSIFVFNGKTQTVLEVFRRPGSDPVALSGDLKNW
ncbi:MAG: hypothetical protein Ta2F_03740 [Termitinemataceae bacterium]|nr:MAG: hypothetical protein Ta2F_03740 [Termitinemataceae bacterium]